MTEQEEFGIRGRGDIGKIPCHCFGSRNSCFDSETLARKVLGLRQEWREEHGESKHVPRSSVATSTRQDGCNRILKRSAIEHEPHIWSLAWLMSFQGVYLNRKSTPQDPTATWGTVLWLHLAVPGRRTLTCAQWQCVHALLL